MSNWQPIETAPEGADILGFCPGCVKTSKVKVMHRMGASWVTQGQMSVAPTHWMPIPEPPNVIEAMPIQPWCGWPWEPCTCTPGDFLNG